MLGKKGIYVYCPLKQNGCLEIKRIRDVKRWDLYFRSRKSYVLFTGTILLLANKKTLCLSQAVSWPCDVKTRLKQRTSGSRQYQYACSLHCSLYIPYVTRWENLLNYEDNLSLIIISFILMTCTVDQVVILLEEIRCLTLLGRGWKAERDFDTYDI